MDVVSRNPKPLGDVKMVQVLNVVQNHISGTSFRKVLIKYLGHQCYIKRLYGQIVSLENIVVLGIPEKKLFCEELIDYTVL